MLRDLSNFDYLADGTSDSGNGIALIDADTGEAVTFDQLSCIIDRNVKSLCTREKRLAFLAIENSIRGVICYLSLLRAKYAVFLSDPVTAKFTWPDLVQLYRPDLCLCCSDTVTTPILPAGYEWRGAMFGHNMATSSTSSAALAPVDDELALLMTTSGSSSKPKLVRLSYENLNSAARQVSVALNISPRSRAILALPLHHVYGLSVLNSHLTTGGSLVFSTKRMMEKQFWKMLRELKVTTLPAVPTSLQLLKSIDESHAGLPPLEVLTSSGGAIPSSVREWVCEVAIPRGTKFFAMYGMTEACGRLSVLPDSRFRFSATDAVGFPVSGGKVNVLQTGEIQYSGPNVMLGYATQRSDLLLQIGRQSTLNTGDCGYLDSEGGLHITGRLSRYCKIFDVRHNLDEIEALFSDICEAAVTHRGNTILVHFAGEYGADIGIRAEMVANRLRVPSGFIKPVKHDEIPRCANGKVLYSQLMAGNQTGVR